jgi:hypothetical protein
MPKNKTLEQLNRNGRRYMNTVFGALKIGMDPD